MTALRARNLVSVDDYLAGELKSQVKHEYLAGVVYAMAGATNAHNRIATNITGLLFALLENQRCQPYNSDTKVRVRQPEHVRFYYPDAFVVCEHNPPEDTYQDEPVLIAEVVSNSTRRIDEGEKKDAYLSIRSLSLYLLAEQSSAEVVVYRRTANGFATEYYQGFDAVIPVPEIGIDLPLSRIYGNVGFIVEPADE